MGKFTIIYLDERSQEVNADGFYQKDNHFEFYKDSAAGEKKVLSLHGANITQIQNLEEINQASALEMYKVSYHSGSVEVEEIQADGYNENGEWFDFYRDSAVGEKIVQSIKRGLVRQIEKIGS